MLSVRSVYETYTLSRDLEKTITRISGDEHPPADSMTIPIVKRRPTTLFGATYWSEILGATKEAPQTVTAKRAFRIAFVVIILFGNLSANPTHLN